MGQRARPVPIVRGAAAPSRELVHYFDRNSGFWAEIYRDPGAVGEAYRTRQRAVLELVDLLRLPPGAAVLDAGCGAGGLAIELGRRGFHVEAVDASRLMVEAAARAVARAGVRAGVHVSQAALPQLPFAAGAFAAVVAVGVLPWLQDREVALAELARVTAPGGGLVVTADNGRRVTALLDPWLNPRLSPFKRRLRSVVSHARLLPPPGPDAAQEWPADVDLLLARAGFRPLRRRTVGFAPLTLLRHELLPPGVALALQRRLQRLADAGRWGLGDRGVHYVVMSERDPGR